jgi:hypothetical protein
LGIDVGHVIAKYINYLGINLIDEAQRIRNIGLTLKICVENFKKKQFLATGSSSFELSNEVNEPLTGRKYQFMLFPLAFKELTGHTGFLEERRLLEQRMIYGYYPEVCTNSGREREILAELCESYLYKDIFSLERIRKPAILEKILQALALQLGSEVSGNELGQTVGADNQTVEHYIDLLEKAFSEGGYSEELGGKLHAFEFKWNERKRAKIPASFLASYPEAEGRIISPANFEGFALGEPDE